MEEGEGYLVGVLWVVGPVRVVGPVCVGMDYAIPGGLVELAWKIIHEWDRYRGEGKGRDIGVVKVVEVVEGRWW